MTTDTPSRVTLFIQRSPKHEKAGKWWPAKVTLRPEENCDCAMRKRRPSCPHPGIVLLLLELGYKPNRDNKMFLAWEPGADDTWR